MASPRWGVKRRRGEEAMDEAWEDGTEPAMAAAESASDREEGGGSSDSGEGRGMPTEKGRLRLRQAIDMGDDAMYRGKLSSKKAIFGTGDDEDAGEEGRYGQASRSESDEDEDLDMGDVSDRSSSDQIESGDDDDFLEEYEALRNEDAKILSQSQDRVETDRARGRAISAQNQLWNKMLHIRIVTQKLLSGANKMPQEEEWPVVVSRDSSLSKEYAGIRSHASDLLGDLLGFQAGLQGLNPELEAGSNASFPRPAEAEKDDGRLTEHWWNALCECHDSYIGHVSSELDRWQRKTTFASAPKAGLKALNQSVSSHIKSLLADPALVSRRTHIAKNSGHRVLCSFGGKDAEGRSAAESNDDARDGAEEDAFVVDEYDRETYDDSGFYQQVLKEFLESQNLGQGGVLAKAGGDSKKRKNVDRKASKGRKIRYHVHEKLVNFMAPESTDRPEFADNLFSSLFACDVL